MFDINKIYSHRKELCHDADMNEYYMISTACSGVSLKQDSILNLKYSRISSSSKKTQIFHFQYSIQYSYNQEKKKHIIFFHFTYHDLAITTKILQMHSLLNFKVGEGMLFSNI